MFSMAPVPRPSGSDRFGDRDGFLVLPIAHRHAVECRAATHVLHVVGDQALLVCSCGRHSALLGATQPDADDEP